MINLGITVTQGINNKANARRDFTTYLSKSKSRYIVSYKNIYLGKNPSTFSGLILRISKFVESEAYDSIGGWMDKETNIYYLDANLHFDTLETATEVATKNGELAIYDTLTNKVITL